ncbi:MAG: hypothetical protein JSS47_13215, partial [Proteobacteria bacterium]|nr:hypothetical protein [Pseudomonadota bacterium]
MKNAATRQVRQLFGALVLGGVMVSGFAASTGQRVTVSGIDIYYGMVPA